MADTQKHYHTSLNHEQVKEIVNAGDRVAIISQDDLTMDVWGTVDGELQLIERHITEAGIHHDFLMGWGAKPINEQ